MDTFYKYKRKTKKTMPHNDVVAQESVAQKYPVVRSRVSKELKIKITLLTKETEKSESELTRLLWENYFKKKEDKAWQEEVNNW